MYYVHQDYLGSILALTNENGTVAERYYFDAWGNRKDPNNWSQNDTRTSFILDRGFTGHEHLDHFNLINMSGRVYDASLGSFLSADPVIQAPNYTQDLNLYSYAYGNPLKYTDPSGMVERPSAELRKNGVRHHTTMNSGHRVNFGNTGPGFADFNTKIGNTWFKNSDLKRDGYQTFYGANALNEAITAIQPRPEYGNPVVTVGDLIFNGFDYSEDSAANGGGYKTTLSSGGLTGPVLNATFSVSGVSASGLQIIQTFYGTRRTDGIVIGTYHWTSGGATYDAFVDGGKNSPYVTLGGNAAAHATMPYYLTAGEVAGQVTWNGTSGTINVYDRPGAIYVHGVARFETIIVATNYNGSGRDKVLGAFQWGWNSNGTVPTHSGIRLNSGVSPGAMNIIKHDYPGYSFY